MPERANVGDDADFRPANRMLPSPVIDVDFYSPSQRSGEQSLPLFNADEMESMQWDLGEEGPFVDPEGQVLLPQSLQGLEGTEWMRPADMGLTEIPHYKRRDLDPDAPPPENPPPVIAKQPRRFNKGPTNIDFYARASSNPLPEKDSLIYHIVCAINTSKQILGGTGQDVWDSIYPKNEKGQAIYNPSGKYVVKLNMMGQWRAVTVDDQMPVVDGACILPRTKDKAELWPLLLTKALLKALSFIPPAAPPAEGEEAADDEENTPQRLIPQLSNQELMSFMVGCITGWKPERIILNECDPWQTLKSRMEKGNVFPVTWGNHPQERLQYIGSMKDADASHQHEDVPHWDAQADSSFLIKADFSGTDNIEVQMPKLSWLLPHKQVPPEGAEGGEEKEEGEEAAGGAEEGAEEGAEKAETVRKLEVMKPALDQKFTCNWETFTSNFVEFIFFHNPMGYENISTVDFCFAPPAPPSTEEEEAPEPPVPVRHQSVGICVDNPDSKESDVLLCFEAASFQCPLRIYELDLVGWGAGAESERPSTAPGAGKGLFSPLQEMKTNTGTALLLKARPGKHYFRLRAPMEVACSLTASCDCSLVLGAEETVLEQLGFAVTTATGQGPSEIEAHEDQLWLRKKLSVEQDTLALLELQISSPAINPVVQLLLVDCENGAIVEGTCSGIGPTRMRASEHGYMVIARSFCGEIPQTLKDGEGNLNLAWSMRVVTKNKATIQDEPLENLFKSNGYFVPENNFSRELFRYELKMPEPGSGPVIMSAMLRAHSPATVNLYLLDLPPGVKPWSSDNVDPVLGRSTESAERDGILTAEPFRFSEGLNSCQIFEAKIEPQEEHTYMCIARLVRTHPLIMMKAKEVEAEEEGEEAEGEGEEKVKQAPAMEMEYVTNEIPEGGEEPFWTFRLFSTTEDTDWVTPSTSKDEKIDEFVGECRENEGREAFVASLQPPEPVADQEGEDAPEGSGPAGEGEDPEGGEEEAEKPVWPPVREEEESWTDYFERYRGLCKPAEPIVKRDPEGPRNTPVFTEEDWQAEEAAINAEVEASKAKWEQAKERRASAKEARAEKLAKLKEELVADAAKRIEEEFKIQEGNLLDRRQKLLETMDSAAAFITMLGETLAKIEVKLEEIEDATPPNPAQKVIYTDQETVDSLLRTLEQRNNRGWMRCMDALKEAGYFEEEEVTIVDVEVVASYHLKKAQDMITEQQIRIKEANAEEEKRIKEEAEAAAAEE